ncbi:MAG: hypothetical protein KAQ98_04190 [Bacteriovoracaceae bacterium]|nr:hypothetical protein [Bacteriovoracaceae bacterium]
MKRTNWLIVLFMICLVASLSAKSVTYDERWNELCSANGVKRKSADVPYPNYDNPEVWKAQEKLSYISKVAGKNVKSDTFWLYSDIERVYGLCAGSKKKKGTCPKITHKGTTIEQNAHNFLTILCGEFRDNIPMLNGKLKWAKNITILKNVKQGYLKSKGVWEQLTGPGYKQLVRFSSTLYDARRDKLGSGASSNKTFDEISVNGVTTCEYRYIIKNYLSTGKELDYYNGLDQYEEGLKAFWKTSECKKWEKTYYNEFRGDGNFKPQSLESNAFIWNTRVFSKNCKTTKTARKSSILTDAQCQAYFKYPFSTRYNLAKEGLYRLFFFPAKFNDLMRNYKRDLVLMTEDLNKDGIADMILLDSEKDAGYFIASLRQKIQSMRKNGQYGISGIYGKLLHYVTTKAAIATAPVEKKYKKLLEGVAKRAEKALGETIKKWDKKLTESKNPDLERDVKMFKDGIAMTNFDGIMVVTDVAAGWTKAMNKAGNKDKGFYEIFPDKVDAWDRIATVLDRHTDWYQIDMLYLGYGFYQPTYSPWVASSYYINKSDAFTVPGYAMGLAGDGHRHWMFVQQVKKDKWFKASDMDFKWNNKGNDAFDLLNTWFDETTFSRSHLGADEQGWDRFGTVAPGELAANLWIYEIP